MLWKTAKNALFFLAGCRRFQRAQKSAQVFLSILDLIENDQLFIYF